MPRLLNRLRQAITTRRNNRALTEVRDIIDAGDLEAWVTRLHPDADALTGQER